MKNKKTGIISNILNFTLKPYFGYIEKSIKYEINSENTKKSPEFLMIFENLDKNIIGELIIKFEKLKELVDKSNNKDTETLINGIKTIFLDDLKQLNLKLLGYKSEDKELISTISSLYYYIYKQYIPNKKYLINNKIIPSKIKEIGDYIINLKVHADHIHKEQSSTQKELQSCSNLQNNELEIPAFVRAPAPIPQYYPSPVNQTSTPIKKSKKIYLVVFGITSFILLFFVIIGIFGMQGSKSEAPMENKISTEYPSTSQPLDEVEEDLQATTGITDKKSDKAKDISETKPKECKIGDNIIVSDIDNSTNKLLINTGSLDISILLGDNTCREIKYSLKGDIEFLKSNSGQISIKQSKIIDNNVILLISLIDKEYYFENFNLVYSFLKTNNLDIDEIYNSILLKAKKSIVKLSANILDDSLNTEYIDSNLTPAIIELLIIGIAGIVVTLILSYKSGFTEHMRNKLTLIINFLFGCIWKSFHPQKSKFRYFIFFGFLSLSVYHISTIVGFSDISYLVLAIIFMTNYIIFYGYTPIREYISNIYNFYYLYQIYLNIYNTNQELCKLEEINKNNIKQTIIETKKEISINS